MSEILNKIDQETKALGEKMAAAMTYDDDGDAVLPEAFTKENLDEDLTIETVTAVQRCEQRFGSALVLALGSTALPKMKENKELDRVTGSVEFGLDVLRASVDRSVITRNPQTGEEKAKLGHVSLKIECGAVAKKGDIKRCMAHIHELFTSEEKAL